MQGCGQTPIRSTVGSEVVQKKDTSQLDGPTPTNAYGFKVSQSAFCESHGIHEVGVTNY